MSNTPYVPTPIWEASTVQVVAPDGTVSQQQITWLPQAQFTTFLRLLYQRLNAVSGQGGQQANISGNLSMGGNTITGLLQGDPPTPDEALSFGLAETKYASLRQSGKPISSSYQAQAGDGTILADASKGGISVQLPDATTVDGRIFPLVKTDSSTNPATFIPKAGQVINGINSVSEQYGKLWVQALNGNWWTVNS
jgi:hypothetical protein